MIDPIAKPRINAMPIVIAPFPKIYYDALDVESQWNTNNEFGFNAAFLFIASKNIPKNPCPTNT